MFLSIFQGPKIDLETHFKYFLRNLEIFYIFSQTLETSA